MLDVTFFARSLSPGQHSLERVLGDIESSLSERIRPTVFRVRPGLPGLRDVAKAPQAQGDVNHITGAVHHVAAVLNGSRTAITVHDIGRLMNLAGAIRAIYRFFWFDLPLSRAAAIIAVSHYTKSELVRVLGVAPGAVTVIHDCVPTGFQAVPREFRKERPTILMVGTAPHKNPRRLVDAVRGLPCRIIFVGKVDEGLRMLLETTAVAFEERFDLDADALRRCYEDADIVYFASTHEGFGLPIVEAQAIGRPVITSRLCSMPEVAGEAALLVNPYDTDEIRRAVIGLCESRDQREEVVGRGFLNVGRFDRKRFGEAHLEIYERLAGS